MDYKIVIFVFIIIIFISVMGYLYFKYEFKEEDATNFVNLTISAEDENLISTNYNILVNGGFYEKSSTINLYPLRTIIPANSSIDIFNSNLDNQNYYTDHYYLNTSEDKNYRVNMKLKNPKELKINHSVVDKIIEITISGEDFREAKFCIRWSLHFLFVRNNEFFLDYEYENQNLSYILKEEELNFRKQYLKDLNITEDKIKIYDRFKVIETPVIYNDFDKCYDLNLSLKDSNFTFTLDFNFFGETDKNDYIELVFFDCDNNLCHEENKDLFGEDKIYKIGIFK